MKYFALAMAGACLVVAALPPTVSWLSLFDVALAGWWFREYQRAARDGPA